MIDERIEEIAKRACAQYQVALYDLEIKPAKKGNVLTIFITKIGGISIEDCQKVSRLIEEELEIKDIMKDKYFLEVSSPGIERPLKLKKHYTSAINEEVKITFKGDDATSAVLIGKLTEVNPDHIVIEENDNRHMVLFSNIKKARTNFEFGEKNQ